MSPLNVNVGNDKDLMGVIGQLRKNPQSAKSVVLTKHNKPIGELTAKGDFSEALAKPFRVSIGERLVDQIVNGTARGSAAASAFAERWLNTRIRRAA